MQNKTVNQKSFRQNIFTTNKYLFSKKSEYSI